MAQNTGVVGDGNVGGGAPGGNPQKPHQKYKKGDRTRRMWIPREEEILAATLAELVAMGWKLDNGFRTGYLQKCEDSIRQEFPTSDVKGNPHIVSKMTAWKTNYNSIRSILARTGVGFNVNGEYKIDIDDDQWEHVVQLDPKAKFMRTKSWPLWETWKVIFGKDRATRAGAESVTDAAVRVRSTLGGGSQCDESDSIAGYDEDHPVDSNVHDNDPLVAPQVPEYSDKQTSVAKTGGVKRKATTSDDMLMDFLANLHAETNTRLEVISSRIGYDFDIGHARQSVFEKLGDVEGLTLDQRYQLCNILGDKPQRLEVFIGMPTEARLGYLLKLMDE